MSRSKTASRPRGKTCSIGCGPKRCAAGGANRSTRLVSHPALDYLVETEACGGGVFYLSLNETDALGHEGKYDEYLKAARRVDGYLRTIWKPCRRCRNIKAS